MTEVRPPGNRTCVPGRCGTCSPSLGVAAPGGAAGGADGHTWRHDMSESLSYRGVGAADRTRTLFGQTMGYVAATTGFFALGAYVGRHLSQGWAIVWFIVAFACLIAMNLTVRRSAAMTVVLLMAVGATLGLAMAPTLVYYASTNPQTLWQAGGATALFIAGFGTAGYATRRDLSGIARMCFWALIALIVFGIVLIFVRLTMFDFQRLRRSKDINSAPLMAASIFLDALNVFLFFLRIFSRGSN